MHSTKTFGLIIIFLINTFIFHFIFQSKGGASSAAVWLLSFAFGAIAAAILHMTTKEHHQD
jgi:hypothetical protein